ncbi:MAG TPA: nickel pincer cofactor biosynthesis protein LarC, partial [Limnochordia bacterium]|nr:nickel pincer cofactor biosynthesis protein LarC [Limnochordia bacterium]
VHFHEVGSTDAIIDVVGCCLALESLGVEALEASPLHLGRGYVRAAHGRMPVPAPATLRLVAGLSAYQTDIEGELTTPTGAALVRGLCRRVGPMPLLAIERVGHGAGARDGVLPNVVRAVLGETVETGAAAATGLVADDAVVELACNLDDATPQLLGALLENLLAHGALDAWIAPVLMKKGRPGHVLHALAPPEQAAALTERLLRESTSLGVRSLRAERRVLEREWRTVPTAGGEVRIKIGRRGSDIYNLAPEYEDCVDAARASGLPLKRILDEAKAQAQALWERNADGR